MASNPYVNIVIYGNSTLIDLSQDTATQADVAQGKYFHLPTGERVQGTAIAIPDGNNMSFGYTNVTLPYVGIAKVAQAVI